MRLPLPLVLVCLTSRSHADALAYPPNGQSRSWSVDHAHPHPYTVTVTSTATVTTSINTGPTPALGQPDFTFDQLYNLQKTFLDAFIYPGNVAQAKAINSSLFAPNIKGRVDLTRTFDGPELNTEYLFGLFTNLALNPDTVSLLGVPVAYDIVHFAANQNIASASSIIYFNFQSVNATIPVEIDTWNLFDANGKILEYDATFRWFQYLFDTLITAAAPLLNTTSPAATVARFQGLIASGICNTAQRYCNGTDQQYDSQPQCMKFLTQDIRFGAAYELGADTLVCRMVHENMVPFRPDVHCPHIGPSGGGMCVDDYTYGKKVLEPYFTNAPFVPYGYQNPNATIAAM